jgi:isocitrate dehydrogenase kinase/phosphatase
VFKVIRDFSSKQAWMGRAHIMEIYRWVHEMNRGRLMLDAWLYRNLHFPREFFDERVLRELVANAPSSVRLDGNTVVLKHVYAQRRVQPLSTFFDQVLDRATRERAIDAMGAFIKDLAGMGFFMSDCYGLPCNTGLTHASNVALFDFDDLGPILRQHFRDSPTSKTSCSGIPKPMALGFPLGKMTSWWTSGNVIWASPPTYRIISAKSTAICLPWTTGSSCSAASWPASCTL